MKKNNVILLGAILLTTPVLAMQDSLPELMEKDMMLRPYVKDLISNSDFSGKDNLLMSIESPTTFRRLNFRELVEEIGGHSWIPHDHEFINVTLHELFLPYSPKPLTSDMHMIFLANILYKAGNKVYEQTSNPIYLEFSASIGHIDAQYKMFSVDFKIGKLTEAKNYLFCSAAQGNPDALLTLSEVYQGYWGMEIPRDLQIAKLLCQEASNLGKAEAQFRIEVATLIEGFFNSQMNYQQGIIRAKELADGGNQRAQAFIKGIMMSSGDSLQEGNDAITDEDLDFLKSFLGWKDSGDE